MTVPDNSKMILFTNSATQRVVAQVTEQGNILISKEWRKTEQDEWTLGKGIEFPRHVLIRLGTLLKGNNFKI